VNLFEKQCNYIPCARMDNSVVQGLRFPVFSLLGAKVPNGNICSQELSFPRECQFTGTFMPENFCSWENYCNSTSNCKCCKL